MKAKPHPDLANECKHIEAYTVASNALTTRWLCRVVISVCENRGEGDHRRSDMQENRGNDDMMKSESKRRKRKLSCEYARQKVKR